MTFTPKLIASALILKDTDFNSVRRGDRALTHKSKPMANARLAMNQQAAEKLKSMLSVRHRSLRKRNWFDGIGVKTAHADPRLQLRQKLYSSWIRTRQRDGTGIFIELEYSDAFWMDVFENGVNGGFGLFVEDREIDFDPRCGNGAGLFGYRESLEIAKSSLWH